MLKRYARVKHNLTKQLRLQTGFTMLEAVVVVGVLLALAAGGFLAYGPITDNAKTSAVRSAASSVYTAILVAQSDGDPSTSAADVVDDYNSSNDQFRAEIREAGTEATTPAMSATGYSPTSDNDFCLRLTHLKTPTIYSEMGNCAVTPAPVSPSPTATSTPTETATPSPTATPTPSASPTPTPTPTVSTAGFPASWGANGDGQLGNNSLTNSSVPVGVTTTGALSGKTVTSVDSADSHTCAIADGKAYCWGYNTYGQLGNGTTTKSSVPVAVNSNGVLAGKTITSVSGGGHFTCAVAAGKAYCWGYNNNGQLGNGTTTSSTVPVAVTSNGALAGKTITSISSGTNSTCVIADGAAYCWGYNNYGQLGNGSSGDSSVPVAVKTDGVLAGKTITSISTGYYHACAVADGAAYCWGSNQYGQIGNNGVIGSGKASYSPVAVSTAGPLAGKTVTSISGGFYHTCAVAEGKAYCWGSGGALGDGVNVTSNVPVSVKTDGVLSDKTAISISSGGSQSCVIAAAKAYCWGLNGGGQLGNNTTTNSGVPVAVNTSGILADKSIEIISTGFSHTVALYK